MNATWLMTPSSRFEVLARQAQLDYATAAGTLPLEALSGRTS